MKESASYHVVFIHDDLIFHNDANDTDLYYDLLFERKTDMMFTESHLTALNQELIRHVGLKYAFLMKHNILFLYQSFLPTR